MGKNSSVLTLDNILSTLESGQSSGHVKTASEQTSHSTKNDLQQAIDSVMNGQEKTASENTVGELEKLASSVIDRDNELLSGDAKFYGRALGEGFIEKLAEVDGLLNAMDDMAKYASEKDYELSRKAGWEDGIKLAHSIWGIGAEEVQEKTASDEFTAGAQYGYQQAYNELLAKMAEDEEDGEEEEKEDKEEDKEDDKEEKSASFNSGWEVGFQKAAQDYLAAFRKQAEDDGDDDEDDEDDGDEGDEKEDEKEDSGEEKSASEEGFEDGVIEGYKYAQEEYEEASKEASFNVGFQETVEKIEKIAEETGSYDFLFELIDN